MSTPRTRRHGSNAEQAAKARRLIGTPISVAAISPITSTSDGVQRAGPNLTRGPPEGVGLFNSPYYAARSAASVVTLAAASTRGSGLHSM
jgi:hypothetical protein